MDKRLLEIGCGEDREEAMIKEFQDQSEYEERIIQLQKIVNKYLAGGEMEKPSVVGSITRNVINPDELARERVPLVGETVREISETIDPMENTQYTRNTENVHFRIAPFQSTVTGDRFTAEEAIGQFNSLDNSREMPKQC